MISISLLSYLGDRCAPCYPIFLHADVFVYSYNLCTKSEETYQLSLGLMVSPLLCLPDIKGMNLVENKKSVGVFDYKV